MLVYLAKEKGNMNAKVGSAKIIVNLEGVNFIDSTALSTPVRGLKLCREQGGDLRQCSL